MRQRESRYFRKLQVEWQQLDVLDNGNLKFMSKEEQIKNARFIDDLRFAGIENIKFPKHRSINIPLEKHRQISRNIFEESLFHPYQRHEYFQDILTMYKNSKEPVLAFRYFTGDKISYTVFDIAGLRQME